MKNVCWNGCSFTLGEGFAENQRQLYVYSYLIDEEFEFQSTNISVAGSSNLEIFKRSAQAILDEKYDIVFTQWSALNRLWLYPGPDSCFFLNDERYPDFKYRDVYIDSKTKKVLRQSLLLLNHDYHNILDLIKYCCILESMCKSTDTKIIFINGLVPWTDDLSRAIPINNFENYLSKYTKSVLDFDSRDDQEILKFFSTLKNHFSKLNLNSWVNVFDSMQNNLIDTGPQGHHPGVQSNQWMAQQISQYLTRNNIQ